MDADQDGVIDACDELVDNDGDGVANENDLCEGHDDGVDQDNDGLPEPCDALVDSDNDTVSDSIDLCEGHDDLLDDDNDGVPDGCDPLLDVDRDGVGDAEDRCPGGNDNEDADGDGLPDACDESPTPETENNATNENEPGEETESLPETTENRVSVLAEHPVEAVLLGLLLTALVLRTYLRQTKS